MKHYLLYKTINTIPIYCSIPIYTFLHSRKDHSMKIIIKNKIVNRKGRKGFFAYCDSGRLKTGYLIYNDKVKNIGIIFRSDDSRKKSSYGQSEMLFDEHFEKEFNRTWHIIKVNKKPFPYDDLKEIMSKNERYEIEIDLKIVSNLAY
ncbi:MAG: hypothetical protein WC006_06120 [Bacilli bacterium]|nr:hypothetical protein [Bacilli bacterium]